MGSRGEVSPPLRLVARTHTCTHSTDFGGRRRACTCVRARGWRNEGKFATGRRRRGGTTIITGNDRSCARESSRNFIFRSSPPLRSPEGCVFSRSTPERELIARCSSLSLPSPSCSKTTKFRRAADALASLLVRPCERDNDTTTTTTKLDRN